MRKRIKIEGTPLVFEILIKGLTERAKNGNLSKVERLEAERLAAALKIKREQLENYQ